MAITTRDGLVAALAAESATPFYRASITTVASTGWAYCLFRASGGNPGASALAVPTTTGRTLDRTSSGASPIPAAGTDTLYLAGLDVVGTVGGTFALYDRMLEYGGLSGIVTTAQTLSALALPARVTDGGVGVELWLDWYTATGSTASASVTASYTNSDGTSGRTATLIGGTPASVPANRGYQLTLQAGDDGVQSVQSVTIGTSTLTAGNVGVTLRKRISAVALPAANIGVMRGYAELALPIIPTDACLSWLCYPTSTASGNVTGTITVIHG